MKSLRWNFQNGIRMVGTPESGEARFIHDAILQRGVLRPVAFPDHAENENVDLWRAIDLWRHNGRSYLSTARRYYANFQTGLIETIAFTEEGGFPKKKVGRWEYALGLPRPLLAPSANSRVDTQAAFPHLTEVTPGHWDQGKILYYRLVPISRYGKLAPGPSVKYQVESAAATIRIAVSRALHQQMMTGYLVCRGTSAGNEYVIGQIPDTSGNWYFDDAGQDQQSMKASDYELACKSSPYLYTFYYDDGARQFEGPPSSVSSDVDLTKNNTLLFDIFADGYWDQPGRQTCTVDCAKIYGPVAKPNDVSTAALGDECPSRPELDVVCTSTFTDWYSGMGVALYDAESAFIGKATALAVRDASSDGSLGPVRQDLIRYADQSSKPLAARQKNIWNGSVGEFTWISYYGTIQIEAGTNGIGRAERVLVYTLDTSGNVANRCTLKSYRRFSDQSLVYLLGEPSWTWTSGLLWARDVLHIQADDSSQYSGLDDGVLVRFRLLGEETDRQGIVHLGPRGFCIETDTTGIENLSLSNTQMVFSYYPNNYGIVGRALYRSGDTGDFLRVAIVPLHQDSFLDDVSTDALGDTLSSHQMVSGAVIQDTPPPLNLRCMTAHEGVLAGLSDDTVRWTRKGYYDAWPEACQAKIADSLVALASYKGNLVVFGRRSIWAIVGSDPLSYQLTKTGAEDGCVAARSVVITPSGIVFLGNRGITIFDGYRTTCIGEGRLKPWQLFPKRQMNSDGSVSEGTLLTPKNVLDTHMGSIVPWVGGFESAPLGEMLGQSKLFGLTPTEDGFLASRAQAFYHRGSYYLYIPSDVATEGQGMWCLNLSEDGTPITHLGAQPVAASVEGDELYLMFRGGV